MQCRNSNVTNLKLFEQLSQSGNTFSGYHVSIKSFYVDSLLLKSAVSAVGPSLDNSNEHKGNIWYVPTNNPQS